MEKILRSIFIYFVYISFVRNVHFSTKNVDNYTLFMILVHEKCGQVGEFCNLSTENVDNLKILHTLLSFVEYLARWNI